MQAKSKNKNSKVKKNSYPKSAIFRPRDLKLFSCVKGVVSAWTGSGWESLWDCCRVVEVEMFIHFYHIINSSPVLQSWNSD